MKTFTLPSGEVITEEEGLRRFKEAIDRWVEWNRNERPKIRRATMAMPIEERREAARRLLEEGVPEREIPHKLGVSPSTVRRYLADG